MFRLFVFFNIICVLALPLPLMATNEEEGHTHNVELRHISSHKELNIPDDSLLLLDLDQTTIHSQIRVSKEQAAPEIRKISNRFLNLVEGKYGQEVSARIRRARIPICTLTEDELPQMLCEMASRGIHILPFTNRTLQAVEHTLREFEALELMFTSWNKTNLILNDCKFGDHTYIDGVLYAKSILCANKGYSIKVICSRLEELGKFTSINVVDDKFENGADLVHADSSFPVPLVFYHYQSNNYILTEAHHLFEFYMNAVVQDETNPSLTQSVLTLVPDLESLLKTAETPLPKLAGRKNKRKS